VAPLLLRRDGGTAGAGVPVIRSLAELPVVLRRAEYPCPVRR
jgi:hypothetical protein